MSNTAPAPMATLLLETIEVWVAPIARMVPAPLMLVGPL